MFLKNDSVYKVGLRTKKEVLEIRPQEVVFILESDLLEMNNHLKVISEEEYNNYKKDEKKKGTEVKVIVENKPSENKKEIKDIPDKCKECYKDNKTPSQEDCDKCKEDEVKNSEGDNKPENNDTQNNKPQEDEKGNLIEKLKEQWQKATKPAEKDKIAKQIKKIQGK